MEGVGPVNGKVSLPNAGTPWLVLGLASLVVVRVGYALLTRSGLPRWVAGMSW